MDSNEASSSLVFSEEDDKSIAVEQAAVSADGMKVVSKSNPFTFDKVSPAFFDDAAVHCLA